MNLNMNLSIHELVWTGLSPEFFVSVGSKHSAVALGHLFRAVTLPHGVTRTLYARPQPLHSAGFPIPPIL